MSSTVRAVVSSACTAHGPRIFIKKYLRGLAAAALSLLVAGGKSQRETLEKASIQLAWAEGEGIGGPSVHVFKRDCVHR